MKALSERLEALRRQLEHTNDADTDNMATFIAQNLHDVDSVIAEAAAIVRRWEGAFVFDRNDSPEAIRAALRHADYYAGHSIRLVPEDDTTAPDGLEGR